MDVRGQLAHPEVVDEKPVLGHAGGSPHDYCTFTGLAKPWPIVQSHAARLGGTVFVVAVVATVAEYHGGRIIVLHTPCIRTVVLWRRGPSKQGGFTPSKGSPQAKGTTGDPFSHARGLVCWTRQPFVHISNLAEPCNSLTPSFPQLKLCYPNAYLCLKIEATVMSSCGLGWLFFQFNSSGRSTQSSHSFTPYCS